MKKNKKKTIDSLKINSKDVGSSEVQIGLLSEKINNLSDHFKRNKNDKHSTRGLLFAVNQRKRLLEYLKKQNPESYKKVISKLNLRKQKEMFKVFKKEIELNGKKLSLETGKIAIQADGAIIA